MDEFSRHDGDYDFGIPDDITPEEAERLGFVEWEKEQEDDKN